MAQESGAAAGEPDQFHLAALIQDYERQTESERNQILDFHVRFEEIFPFEDGNGRVGRLIMFKECLRLGTMPFIIDDKRRSRYLRGIKERHDDRFEMIDVVMEAPKTALRPKSSSSDSTQQASSLRQYPTRRALVMKMNEFMTALQPLLTTQQPSYPDNAESILEMLFDAYNESSSFNNVTIKADFEELYRLMNGKPLKEIDEIIYAVCTLCRDHEKARFIEGVRVGIRLLKEVNIS